MESNASTTPPLPNYFLVGADQRPYGPVTAEQVRQWINEGRANGQTQARKEQDNYWQPLSAFPEFADALAAKSGPKAPPPPLAGSVGGGAGKANVDAVLNEALSGVVDVQIGSCLSRAWNLLISDFWPIIGYSAVMLLLIGVANAAYVGIVVNGPLLGGMFAYYVKRVRGEPADWNTLFSGFTASFLALFLTALISGLLTGVGLLLCIIPGIYLAVAWHFSLLLVVDKHLEFWDAMEVSRKVVNRCWWPLFGLLLLGGLINIIGSIVCFGVFVTAPLSMCALAHAYEDIFNRKPAAGY